MAENTQENMDLESRIEARAREIRAAEGGSLIDALLRAESELKTPEDPALPASFTVTIPVKPRVARWIIDIFGGHETFTIEERMGAYLATVLNRSRVQTIRANEPPAEVRKGDAVSLRRHHMEAQKG